ncbi:hypothetical protein S40288_09574 [Stachybotrys chartarum IBT 40288]|nr:hypothetical protein S40288_09574 [Stachybotrys chartarum IBT 40288]
MRPNTDDAVQDAASDSESDQAPQRSSARRRQAEALSKDEGPACQSCRRRKAKCTRQQPCSQCERNDTECIYDEIKAKPGMRAGAIEHLNQRISSLEHMFLGQSVVWHKVLRHLDKSPGSPDLPETTWPPAAEAESSLQNSIAQIKDFLSTMADSGGIRCPSIRDDSLARSSKRRRLNSNSFESASEAPARPSVISFPTKAQTALPDDLMDSLVEIYFERIHPWIPMLHVRQFRIQLSNPVRRQQLSTILHAMVSLCARFSNDERLGNAQAKMELSRRSREAVILNSMESFSVANLQALIICAFDTVANGRGPSAWSIIGSMTRTAEQLQLSVEDESQAQNVVSSNTAMTRLAFLPPANDWCEAEERRRVFWNIFLMDRFCSISTGWNLSLTSADVRRRLPCEGGLWEAGEPPAEPTPYFGLADHTSNKDLAPGANGRHDSSGEVSLGGFAYCIEATESLSQVTSFFLRQTADMSKVQDAQIWLMRFKQLDLRLMQWKLFLPAPWREACAVNADGNMDPNLTLAHITHNTAVVVLHQSIAYPSTEWQLTPIKLPSQASAETCLTAAIEVATIAEHFLRNSSFLANPQFAFCLFVCGRMLLSHAKYYKTQLVTSFKSLVDSLEEINKRWGGPDRPHGSATMSGNLASKFVSRLLEAFNQGSTTVGIRQAAYSEDGGRHDNYDNLSTKASRQTRTLNSSLSTLGVDTGMQLYTEASPDSISLAFPPLPQAFWAPSAAETSVQPPSMTMNGVNGAFPYHSSVSRATDPTRLENENNQHLQVFADFSTYLNNTVMPGQRISMYEQPETDAS